jgi:N-acetylneuraminic acid mutarotase
MRHGLLCPSLLTLSTLGLAACGEGTTQPNSAADQPAAQQLAVTSNTWLTRRDMPLELVNQTAAVVPNALGQSIVYAIGGQKPGLVPVEAVPMGEVRAYNVATNTWTSKRDMPVARWGMNGAGVINGKIYVTGGWDSKLRPTASVFAYDPTSDTWTRKRDMPAAGGSFGSGVTGVIGGKLYVVSFASYNYVDPLVNFSAYNPTTNSWTKLPKPPDYPVVFVGGGVINKKLYMIGTKWLADAVWGYAEFKVLEYDPITNRWTKKLSWTTESCLPNFPCQIYGPTVVMLSHVYVIQGEPTTNGGPATSFIYDPVTNTWASKPLLTTFSYGSDALAAARVYLNGQPRLEVFGGYRPGNNQQYIP